MDIEASWSPDQSAVAFRNLERSTQIILLSREGNLLERIDAGPLGEEWLESFKWSPDGQSLLFIGKHRDDEGQTIIRTLYVRAVKSGDIVFRCQLPADESSGNAVIYWSPDGQKVAYSNNTSSPLWVIDIRPSHGARQKNNIESGKIPRRSFKSPQT